jgi:hypothetical protein
VPCYVSFGSDHIVSFADEFTSSADDGPEGMFALGNPELGDRDAAAHKADIDGLEILLSHSNRLLATGAMATGPAPQIACKMVWDQSPWRPGTLQPSLNQQLSWLFHLAYWSPTTPLAPERSSRSDRGRPQPGTTRYL